MIVLALGGLVAAPEELADFETKAEYAFFTEDANALRGLLAQGAALADAAQPLALYRYAHAEFRLQQLARAGGRAREAAQAGTACADTLDRALALQPNFAEALALDAACNGYLAASGGLRGRLAARRAESRLAAARALAAANGRVLLVAGLLQWFGPPADGARAGARKAFERATAAFDTVAATPPGEPTWGAAEAWLFLGRALEDDGALLGARNAYEKSLLIAPQFAAARRRLAALAARR